MFRHSNPHNFGSSGSPGAVVPLIPTDEFNQPISRMPRTVEEANGINTEQPEATASDEAQPKSNLRESARDYAGRLLSPAWIAVENYPAHSDELRQRKSELLDQLRTVIDAAASFLADARAAHVAALEEEREKLRVEIRKVIAQRAELVAELNASDDQLRRAQADVSRSRLKFAEIESGRPSFYPSKPELAEWGKKLELARTNRDAALASEAEVISTRDALTRKIAVEQEKLNGHRANVAALNDVDRPGLLEREEKLRCEIEGREYHDRSLGLSSALMTMTLKE